MRFVRYGEKGFEKPGMLDDRAQVRSLAGLIEDIDTTILTRAAQEVLKAIDPEKLPIVEPDCRLGMPVTGIRQIIAVAGNYRAHVEERGNALPREPMIFHKSIGSLCGPTDDITLPPDVLRRRVLSGE